MGGKGHASRLVKCGTPMTAAAASDAFAGATVVVDLMNAVHAVFAELPRLRDEYAFGIGFVTMSTCARELGEVLAARVHAVVAKLRKPNAKDNVHVVVVCDELPDSMKTAAASGAAASVADDVDGASSSSSSSSSEADVDEDEDEDEDVVAMNVDGEKQPKKSKGRRVSTSLRRLRFNATTLVMMIRHRGVAMSAEERASLPWSSYEVAKAIPLLLPFVSLVFASMVKHMKVLEKKIVMRCLFAPEGDNLFNLRSVKRVLTGVCTLATPRHVLSSSLVSFSSSSPPHRASQ